MNVARRVLLRCEGLGLRFGARRVLRDINFTLAAGERVALSGPNGSGKTVLARLLLGLLRPSCGSLWRAAALRAGYVPQHFTLDAALPLTVRGLAMAGLVRRLAASPDGMLRRVGMAHMADADAHSLSGGEMRRVLLARALLLRPPLLVLDEPASTVDADGRRALYGLIHEECRVHGCGLLLISHNMDLAASFCDRLLRLDGVLRSAHVEASAA